MHILLIPSYYPTVQKPIPGIFFHQQAQVLAKAGHQLGVLVTPRLNATLEAVRRDGIRRLKATTRDEHFNDFPVYRMHWGWALRVTPLIHAALVASAGIRAFDQYCKKHGTPDVIHAHNVFYGGWLAARIGEKRHIPTVLTEHSSSYIEGLIFLPGQHFVARYTLNHIDKKLAVGPQLVTALGRYTDPQRIEIIGNMVDTEYFQPSDTRPPDEPFELTAIGDLNKNKAPEVLITAFGKAFHGKNARLHIGGDGPRRAEMEQLARNLKVQEQVEFLGWLSREQVRSLIWRSHAIVSSSHVETFGVILIEAMACGKPVVTTASGGPQMFVNACNGLLATPGDPDDLARAMQKMRKIYDQYKSDEIRVYCVDRFSEPVVSKKLQTIYQSIAKH